VCCHLQRWIIIKAARQYTDLWPLLMTPEQQAATSWTESVTGILSDGIPSDFTMQTKIRAVNGCRSQIMTSYTPTLPTVAIQYRPQRAIDRIANRTTKTSTLINHAC